MDAATSVIGMYNSIKEKSEELGTACTTKDWIVKADNRLTSITQHPPLLMIGKEYNQKLGTDIGVLSGMVSQPVRRNFWKYLFYTGTQFGFKGIGKHPWFVWLLRYLDTTLR